MTFFLGDGFKKPTTTSLSISELEHGYRQRAGSCTNDLSELQTESELYKYTKIFYNLTQVGQEAEIRTKLCTHDYYIILLKFQPPCSSVSKVENRCNSLSAYNSFQSFVHDPAPTSILKFQKSAIYTSHQHVRQCKKRLRFVRLLLEINLCKNYKKRK